MVNYQPPRRGAITEKGSSSVTPVSQCQPDPIALSDYVEGLFLQVQEKYGKSIPGTSSQAEFTRCFQFIQGRGHVLALPKRLGGLATLSFGALSQDPKRALTKCPPQASVAYFPIDGITACLVTQEAPTPLSGVQAPRTTTIKQLLKDAY
jgi:hypothetical protein